MDNKSETLAVNKVHDLLPGRVFQIPAGTKKATLKDWPNVASADPDQVDRWANAAPESNWGFVPDSGFFVLDIDRKDGKDGFAKITELEAEFGALPDTLTATTPSGGQHRYFRNPGNLPVKSQSDAAGYAGVDFRCPQPSAGYVVLPPSRTEQGVYAWLDWNQIEKPHIADAPRWLITLATGTDPRELATTSKRVRAMASADLDDEDERDPDLLQHLREALQHLDADEYDLWIGVGQALKSLDDPEALQVWLEWSATSPQFKEREAEKKWQGFHPKRTGFKSIFAKAQAAGWINPGKPRNKIAEAIAEFNEKHAVILAGGSVCILREGRGERGGTSVDFMPKSAFLTLYENRTIKVSKVNADGDTVTKKVPFAKIWLTHPDRRTHEGVTFAPSGKAPAGYYNLWRGYAVEPLDATLWRSARACKRFLHHLKHNICKGNRFYFRYLLAWLANMIQDPDRKPGVALVLRGKKGTGKSKVADILRGILGGHAFKASKSEHIVGRFSSHLADKLLLVAEESFFAGGKADTNTLKDLITSDTITCEQKHIPAFEMRSCHRVIMITNNEWAVPATEDERRFFVLDVGEDHMQDHAYFGAIDAEMFDGDGCRAFLRLLQVLDISGVNLRAAPQTEALQVQKRLSLEPHDQFILDALQDGEICGRAWMAGGSCLNDPIKADVYDAYVAYCRARQARPIASNRFGPHFEKRTGAGTWQPGEGSDRRRRYQLLDVEATLSRFDGQLGVPPANR